jgi:hypothetical protein
MPPNWDPSKLPALPSPEAISKMDRREITKQISVLKTEIRRYEKVAELPKAGDFIIWDMRSAHQNGIENKSKQVRQTFYHAYLPVGNLNEETIETIKTHREQGRHPPDFPKSHASIEEKFRRCDLNDLGNLLYNYRTWTDNTQISNNTPTYTVTPQHIAFFPTLRICRT